MRRLSGSTAALALAFALAVPALAQGQAKPAAAPVSVKDDVLRSLDDARQKLLQLAEAIPAEKFSWRPAEGVRSTGEVLGHVSATNYFLPTIWGAKVPAGVDPRAFEKEGGDKAKVIDTLKKSFDHVREVIAAVPEGDLDKPVKLLAHEGTVREAIVILATHAHEHLGQSIAYARRNGIVPPWSK
jgi:uncharacterized damage-inducible protein DinB